MQLVMADASGGRFERKSNICEAASEMKSGMAPRLGGFRVECFMKGGMVVLELLVRLLKLSFDMRVVPLNWSSAPVQGKGDEYECSNSRGNSLLSVVTKLHDRVLIKRVRTGTECEIGKE